MSQNKIFYIILLICALSFSCAQSGKYLYREKERRNYPYDNDLKIIIKNSSLNLLQDSFYVKVYYVNNFEDEILLPLKDIKPYFQFQNDEIKQNYIVNVNEGFPELRFKSLKEKKRQKIIKNNCEPHIKIKDYHKLSINDTLCKLYDLKDLKYIGFNSDEEYKFVMKVYISDEIKKYCPKIWSGTIISDTILLKTNK